MSLLALAEKLMKKHEGNMKKTIPAWKSFEYVEVRIITEMKDGLVFRTKVIGFAHRDRPRQDNERYASLSTSMTQGKETVELSPFME